MLLPVKSNQKTLYRQIGCQFQGKRRIPFTATDQEKRHGRDTVWELRAKEAPEHVKANWPGSAWIVEMVTTTTRNGDTTTRRYLFITSIRTAPEALLQLMCDRWSMEGWHWIRDTQLHEDAHRYRGNGAGVMATLRAAALYLLRLTGVQSIRSGMQAVMRDITALLAMAMRQPEPKPC